MTKLYKLFFLTFFLLTSSQTFSQNVNVSSPSLTYPDLGTAFIAINNGVHTGNISIEIAGNTTELVSAVLNASGSGSASYTSISIQPSGGASRTITGSIAGHLIDLNGADNVSINGLNAGGNSLTISNTATGASSAVRFIADASNNLITNCTIQGSASTASNGVILFSTGTTTGNDGNTISNCNITGAGVNLPVNGIYSLGTVGAENGGNIISSNNIYDFFSASLASTGINLVTTNVAWTISGNKLYQTANRTYTTANTHMGISIVGGDNYTINNNVIGYANSSGTGTTNMIGLTSGSLGGTFPSAYTTGGTANATRYIAINCTLVGAIASSIQNNTIAGFAFYTSSNAVNGSGIFCGININSGNVNIGTITGNTIGSSSDVGSIYTATTSTGATTVGINCGSGTVNIKNNLIGAVDAMGTTAGINGGITAISTSGAGTFTITNNIIGNTTNPNLRTGNLTTGANLSNVGTTFGPTGGAGTLRGILTGTGTAFVGTVAEPNIIRNMNNNSGSSNAVYRAIETGTTGNVSIVGNLISNMTSRTLNNSEATPGAVGIYYASTPTNGLISQNTISNLSISNTDAVGSSVAGIFILNATNLMVSRNIIYDLSNAATSVSVTDPSCVSGILLRTGNDTNTVVNNMITLGNGQNTNTSFIGIWGNHGGAPNPVITKIYYNTVYITGTASSGAQPSFGYYRGDFSATARTVPVDIRNNILYNDRNGGTGSHFAIANNYGATASAAGWSASASNFNVFNANASTIGYWTTVRTFDGWKTISAGDINSLSNIPVTFVAPALGNLRLNMGLTPTQLESGASVLSSVTTDIDGFARPKPGAVNGGGYAPDFGASESDMVPLDLISPVIIYTPLKNAASTGNRTLTVNITDLSGVQTGVNGPRLYFKKSTDPSYLFDNNPVIDGNNYTFILNAEALSGVTIGTVIQYYVAAQDVLGNAGTNPLGGSGSNPPGTTPPPAPNFYTVVPGLSGTYTVGPGGDFLNLTAVASILDSNSSQVIGNTIFELNAAYNGTAGETLPLNMPQFNNGGLLFIPFTVTIRPASGVTAKITSGDPGSNLALGVINFEGGDYYILDGRPGGSGTSKEWTIRNTRSASAIGCVVRFVNDATNNTLQYLNMESQATLTTTGVVFLHTSTGTQGNSFNSILNNNISGRTDVLGATISNGIFSSGSALGTNHDNIVSNNHIFNFQNIGINLLSSNDGNGANWTITNNHLYNPAAISTTTQTGISIASKFNTNTIITGNYVGGSAPFGAGMWVNSSNALFSGIVCSNGAGTISNNVVSNVTGSGTGTGARIQGIGVTSQDGIYTVSNNNVFNLMTYGTATGTGFNAHTARGIYVASNGTPLTNSVTGNTVDNISTESTNALTTSNMAVGISLFNIQNTVVSNNKISNIKNKTTGTEPDENPMVCGIYANSLNNTVVANNMISIGTGENTNTQFNGIWQNGLGTTLVHLYYFNTIVVSGTSGGAIESYAFKRGTDAFNGQSQISVLRDNILIMTRTGGTAVNYTIGNPGSAPGAGWTSNYNDIYNSNSARIGFWGAAGYDSTGWRTASSSDANSRFVSVSFIDIATGNLHITAASNGDLNLTGTPIAGITTDFDGNTRNPDQPYMGADEGTIPLPVELTSFSASSDRNSVKLIWTTLTELNNSGFDIERQISDGSSSNSWIKIANVHGNGNSNEPKNYTYSDNGLQTGKYLYRLKQIDYNGNFTYFTLDNEISVGVPKDFTLSQNYPNPFNPVTKINYDLPIDSKVNLKVYDMLGKEVASLVNNDLQKAGYYTVQLNGVNLASGTYFFRIVAQGNGKDFVMTKKMVLIK